MAIIILNRKTTLELQKNVEENKTILNDVDDSLKQRIVEAEDFSLNIRVELENTKEAFDNSLIGQDEELKTLIKNTQREIQSRSNDNLDKQNSEVQMRLGELSNQIELTHDKLKREKLETDEHFRNIGQSISSLKDESQHAVADKISELEKALQ